MKTHGIQLSWIVVKNLKEAIEFYQNVVGLTLKEYHEEYKWAEMAGPEGSILGIGEENAEYGQIAGTNAVITITVDDIESARSKFLANSATLVGEVMEIPGHVKMQTFRDRDGNVMQLVQQMA